MLGLGLSVGLRGVPPLGASVAAWTPAALFAGGEQGVWYDPSDLSSMFQDSAGTIAAAVGQPVGRINDKSGRGNHATQATSTKRPLLQQDAGGNYYLLGDGADDFIQAATFTISQPFDRISAVRTVTWADLDRFYTGGPGTTSAGMFRNTVGSPQIGIHSGVQGPTTGALAVGVTGVTTERFNGASSGLAINNGAYTAGGAGANNPNGITLFANPDGSACGNHRIYQTVMIARQMTDAEITETRAFIAAKAGVAL